jgi:predicted nucleotidyltransferase
MGLSSFEQYEDPDTDRVIYNLQKFCKLALNGNPNILELLWLDPKFHTYRTREYMLLRDNRASFLSKRICTSYLGYVHGQMQRLTSHKDKPVREGRNPARAALEAKYGYDTKHASHVIRLLIQGAQLLKSGGLEVTLQGANLAVCKEIKHGLWSFDEFADFANKLREQFQLLEQETDLPAHPDVERIERLLVDLIYDFRM